MLASKFCVVVNKCPMFNREQMPNIQLKFASSRFCAAYAATILALCCTVQCLTVNKCPTYSSNSPFQGFSAAYAATILALCCAVQCLTMNKTYNIQLKFASSRLLRSLRCYNSRFMLYCPVFACVLACEHADPPAPLYFFVH